MKNVSLKDNLGENIYPETDSSLVKNLRAAIIDVLNTLPTSKVVASCSLTGITCSEGTDLSFYPGGHVNLHFSLSAPSTTTFPLTVSITDAIGQEVEHTWNAENGLLSFIMPENEITITIDCIEHITISQALIFRASTDGLNHVSYTAAGSHPDLRMKYSLDGFFWKDWAADTQIELNGKIGEYLYVKNESDYFTTDSLNKITFKVDEVGTDVAMLDVSGNIYALLNMSDTIPLEIPAWSFYAAFDNCKTIRSLPKISIPKTINEKIFYCFAYNCSSLKVAEADSAEGKTGIIIEQSPAATSLGAFQFMFNGTGGSFNQKDLHEAKCYYWYYK